MPVRPSEPLLRLIRDTARGKGMNTAALALSAGLERSRLKHVLSGSEPLTVDEMIALSQALELDEAALAGMPDEQASTDALRAAPEPRVLSDVPAPQAIIPDPYGNHAEQAMRLGLSLGCDIFLLLDPERLVDSGIPPHIRKQHPERLPVRLDAAFQAAQDPRFLPEGLQVNLSFDSLYTVVIPWDAFSQVGILPLPPEPLEEAPEPTDSGGSKQRGHLRLID